MTLHSTADQITEILSPHFAQPRERAANLVQALQEERDVLALWRGADALLGRQVPNLAVRRVVRALLGLCLLALGGCSVLSDFDGYEFGVDASEGVDASMTSEPDAGIDAAVAPPAPGLRCDQCAASEPPAFEDGAPSEMCAEGLYCRRYQGFTSCQRHCECDAGNETHCGIPCSGTDRCLNIGTTDTNAQGVTIRWGFCLPLALAMAGYEGWQMPLLDSTKLKDACRDGTI